MTMKTKNNSKLTTCPCCNVGKLEPKILDYKIQVQDDVEIVVPKLEVEQCDHCGEIALPARSAEKVDQAIEEANEQLEPRELERIREDLGWDQTRMSEICGFGLKTFHRWERGIQVPSRSMGYYLRIIHEFPEAAEWLKDRGWRNKNRIGNTFDQNQLEISFEESFPDLCERGGSNPETDYLKTPRKTVNWARAFTSATTK